MKPNKPMKTSRLIKALQKNLEKNGDLSVYMMTEVSKDEGQDGDVATLAGFVTMCEEIKKKKVPDYILLCDIHGLDAFR